MRQKTIIKTMLLTLLMAVAGAEKAHADETDMSTWVKVDSYSQTTSDGFSLWDGQSYQDYVMDNGWYAGIHIKNAAQLAGYAYAMYNDWENVYRQNVYLDCDVDLGGYTFSILRDEYYNRTVFL